MITRTWPVWRQTKRRPSGANSIAVGRPERFAPNCVSTNPNGKLAPLPREQPKMTDSAIMKRTIVSLESAM